jgi:hypothetical protein
MLVMIHNRKDGIKRNITYISMIMEYQDFKMKKLKTYNDRKSIE